MRRTALIVLVLSLFALSTASDAQRRRPARDGKVDIPCPQRLRDIRDCPDTGCGHVDPHMNRQKNIRSDNQRAEPMTLAQIRALDDPVPDFKIGDTREKLKRLGEGNKVRVVAFALVVRQGVKESTNCGLTRAADTDNHIVLVDRLLRRRRGETPKELLDRREKTSTTAEFTPRTRLDHSNLTRANLKPLIDQSGGALKVRITGLLFFDSEHSRGAGGHPLQKGRSNNWEIHPVMALEYCPRRRQCTLDSNDNWKDLGEEP